MRNITLSAAADLIERARERASRENTTLNAAFRERLQRYAGQDTGSQDYAQIMRRLRHVRSARRFFRDERNQR